MKTQREYTAEGIVIKKKNLGETDRLITFFTKNHGKIVAIAKGVRRITSRRSGHLEIFGHVFISLKKGISFDTIKEANRYPTSLNIFPVKNINNTMYRYYLCELVDRLLADHQKHIDVYKLLLQSLQEIEKHKKPYQLKKIIYSFSLQLLWSLGFLPKYVKIPENAIVAYIERIIERKLHTPLLLTAFRDAE